MSAARHEEETARGRLLDAWEPPAGAGAPIGVVATTFTFDASFFEEELLGRFLAMETAVEDGRAWLAEREQKLGVAGAVVLADRRHVARSSTLAWDLLGVSMPGGTCQHSKVALLAWERHVRAIVGSANLTEAAYRRNLETFAVLDFHAGAEVPAGVLAELIAFLRRMLERVPDPADSDRVAKRSPRLRGSGLLDALEATASSLGLPQDWKRGATRVVPVLLEPTVGSGVLEQLRGIWGARALPNSLWLQAPFWPDPEQRGCETLAAALRESMALRGAREVHLLAPGFEDTASGRWHIELPEALPVAVRTDSRCRVVFHPVPTRQGDDNRPLHAKLSRWSRDDGSELLLLGSSNASLSGLGVGRAPRNIEANLCFVPGSERASGRWFERCFPEAPALEEAQCASLSLERRDDEGGPPPLPAFFRWACFAATQSGGVMRVGFGPDAAPEKWCVVGLDGRIEIDSARYVARGSPPVWSVELTLDPKHEVPPSALEVRWSVDAETYLAHLPVNALDDESRSRPDLWADLDLETLLQLLATGGQLHRVLARRSGRRTPTRSENDVLRRFDSSQLLMQRIRRISSALEGLCERLSAPVASEAALEWRFRGPLSPSFFAKRLAESATAASERRFLVVEVALAVGRAARVVRATGLPRERVAQRYAEAVRELRQLATHVGAAPDDLLDGYVARAFERATVDA